MLKGAVVKEDTSSPLEELAGTIAALATNRRWIVGMVSSVSDWPTVLEDIAMLVNENVTIGLRTQWARRVAVPVVFAYRALHNERLTPAEQKKAALDNLQQCTDVKIRDACVAWVKRHV